MTALLLLFVLGATPVVTPADGLTLMPGPPRHATIPTPTPPAIASVPSQSTSTGVPVGPPRPLRLLFLGLVVAAIAAIRQRAQRTGEGDGPLVVFVPGHAAGSYGTFSDLIAAMGLGRGDYLEFDYRMLHPSSSHENAARKARSRDISNGLAGMVAGIGGGRPLYLIGHSKGAVAIADLLASWDDAGAAPAHVIGAALLDPPMDGGLLGWFQSVGILHDAIPSDGGYDPYRCGFLFCRDTRDGLGRKAGVDVIVIRNPEALVTNFWGKPDDLRVFDLDDDGPHPMMLLPDLGAAIERIHEAHESVLRHPDVAACLLAEINTAAGCRWQERRWRVYHPDRVKSVGGGSHVLVT